MNLLNLFRKKTKMKKIEKIQKCKKKLKTLKQKNNKSKKTHTKKTPKENNVDVGVLCGVRCAVSVVCSVWVCGVRRADVRCVVCGCVGWL